LESADNGGALDFFVSFRDVIQSGVALSLASALPKLVSDAS